MEQTVGRLVVKRSGAETEVEFPVNPPAVIGRFDPAVGPIDIDLGGLPEGSYVSRKHAKIVFEDGVWKVKDMGSSNGTFLLKDGDFAREDEAELHDGAEIALGNARFVFYTNAPAEGEADWVSVEESTAGGVDDWDAPVPPLEEPEDTEASEKHM